MKYLIIFLFIILLGCENVKHKIGISTKPFSKNDGFENSTKLNYSLIFGKIRVRKSDGTEDDD